MFDFVIVGAGSAGCVLANRLTADGKRKVALLEAGPHKHRTFKVRAPGLYQQLWRTPLDWAFSTEPQAHCDNRRHFWPRGKVTGGSGSFNALLYVRGHRANYDGWRDLGNPGWGYADVLPYFKKSEQNVRGASDYHGADGPLPVVDTSPRPVSDAFVEAAATRCKTPRNTDFNGADQEGVGAYQISTRGGVRVSTAIAFLEPALARGNLTVITEAHATSLVVDGDRVTGVRYRARGRDEVVSGKQIILSGGAIGSPHLLMLSGIGAGDELRAAGVEPRHELPGVGKHLEDHLLHAVVHEVTTASTITLSKGRLLMWVAQHLATKSGPLASPPIDVGGFVKIGAGSALPDLQFHCAPFGVGLPTDDYSPMQLGRCMSICPSLIYPRSHGEIRLRSADPAAAPVIDPRYFSAPEDLDLLVAGMKLSREIAATAPLAGMLGKEIFPGPDVNTDDELRASIRKYCNTIFHPTGTCKMGTDAMAVVDSELRVRGLRGLRVADASIMPTIVGGNTNAPTIMIAERCADLVQAEG